MIKYKIIWNGEELEETFDTMDDAEDYAFQEFITCKYDIDEKRAKSPDGSYWEDYPEYEVIEYETSVLQEWISDLRRSIDMYDWENRPFNPDCPPCPHCGTTMKFNADEGHWDCDECYFSISEKDVRIY